LAIDISTLTFPKLEGFGDTWLISALAENLLLADYEFTLFKSKKDAKKKLAEVVLVGTLSKEGEAGLKRGQVVGEYMNMARDIANTPGGHMSPTDLSKAAKNGRSTSCWTGDKERNQIYHC
jgi:leucyl aminopeptidase